MRFAWFLLLLFSLADAFAQPVRAFRVYVTNERSNNISVIDGDALVVIATWPVGKRPRGVHLAPDGRLLYVAVSGSPRLGPGVDPDRAKSLKADKSADGIAVIDVRTGRLMRKMDVGSDPEEFAISADGKTLYVSNEDEAQASAWDIASGRRLFAAAVSEEPEGVALHPTRPEVYVTCEALGDVFVLDNQTGARRAVLRVGGRPRQVAFSRDGAWAYVPVEGKAELAIIDAGAHRLTRTISIPGPGVLPMAVALSANGSELFVSTGRGNSIAVIDRAQLTISASIPVGTRVWGIGLSPDGRALFTANGASDDVSVVDTSGRKEIKRIKAGAGPWGVAVGPHVP